MKLPKKKKEEEPIEVNVVTFMGRRQTHMWVGDLLIDTSDHAEEISKGWES